MTIKVECACGQNYAFEVDSTAQLNAHSILCPECGADGTNDANQSIVRQNSSTTSNSGGLRVHKAESSASPTPSIKFPQARKSVTSEQIDWELLEAKLDTQRSAKAGFVVAVICLIQVILSFFGIRILGTDAMMLFDVVFITGISIGTYRLSRTCAVLMLIYYFGNTIVFFILFKATLRIIRRAIFLYFFARGVQAAFAYHRLKRQAVLFGNASG